MFAPVSIFCGEEYCRNHSAGAASDTIQLRNAPARAKVHSIA
jgi:hypothetical protein